MMQSRNRFRTWRVIFAWFLTGQLLFTAVSCAQQPPPAESEKTAPAQDPQISQASREIALQAQAQKNRAKQAQEQEEEKLPPPLTHYKGREIAQTMHFLGASWLTRDSREREEDCTTLLKVLKVQPGQVVCDLGCGNGFYTLKLADLVGPKGTILAVDIQQEMLHLLSERAKEQSLTNIKPILATQIDPKLQPESVDLMLIVDVYHELSYPEQVLAAVRKSLKPKGRVALVEFRLEDPNVPIKLEHKMTKKQILKEFIPNGFKLVDQYDGLPWQHVMFFEKGDLRQEKNGKKDKEKKKSSEKKSRNESDAEENSSDTSD